MTRHDHQTYQPGCFRCDPTRQEAEHPAVDTHLSMRARTAPPDSRGLPEDLLLQLDDPTVAEMGGLLEGGPDSVEWLRDQRSR